MRAVTLYGTTYRAVVVHSSAHAPRHEVGDAGEGTRAEGMAMTTSRAASCGAATGARSGQRERDLRVSGRPVEAFEPDGQHDEWDREEAEASE